MKNRVNKFLLFLILISFSTSVVTGCVAFEDRGQEVLITKKIAVEIADKKAKELNYDIERMDVIIDEQNTKWNNYLAASGIKNLQPELAAPLENKNYWAIYYQPRWLQKGGDLWIFVDKKSGDVITVIQGE